MTYCAQQLRKVIRSYHLTLVRSALWSTVLLFVAALRLRQLNAMSDLYLFLGGAIGWLILVLWELFATNKPVKHLARRLRLDSEQTSTFTQDMGLLNHDPSDESTLTMQLRDRALASWVEPVRRVCCVGWWAAGLLVIQAVLVGALWLVHRPQSQPPEFVDHTSQRGQADNPLADTQRPSSTMNQLAHDLLQMRDALKQSDATRTDTQSQQLMDQLNALWQQIQSQLASASMTADQLQSSTSMPISKSQSLQSERWRKRLEEALTDDITTLARQGARFDGPGMISRGTADQLPNPQATPAQGRYHEAMKPGDLTANSSTDRRLLNVPLQYREAVARYFAGKIVTDNKGPKESSLEP